MTFQGSCGNSYTYTDSFSTSSPTCQSNENYAISYMLRLSREWGNQSKVDRSKNLKCWINFQKFLHSTARVFREKFVHLPQSIQLKYINFAKAFCLANQIINWDHQLALTLASPSSKDKVPRLALYLMLTLTAAYGSVSFAVLCWVSGHVLAFLLKMKRYWDTAFSVLWLFACWCVPGARMWQHATWKENARCAAAQNK